MLALRRAARPATTSLRQVRCSHHGTHGHSGRPEEVEMEKLKTLKGESESPMDHAPKWNDKLASDSETKVKAMKDKRSPEELQKDTASEEQKQRQK